MIMKNLFYLTVLLLLFMGCSKDNSNDEEEAIVGKWQIIESCYGIGDGTWGCTDIENGNTIRFNEGGTFNYNNGNNECLTGSYTFNSFEITLQYNNNECNANDGVASYKYSFIENNLKLENLFCVEGCYEVHKRIDLEE